MSLTFTKKDSWIKNEIERDVELNPYWTKNGIVKHALIEHYARRRDERKVTMR